VERGNDKNYLTKSGIWLDYSLAKHPKSLCTTLALPSLSQRLARLGLAGIRGLPDFDKTGTRDIDIILTSKSVYIERLVSSEVEISRNVVPSRHLS
jgi:hypothetical protein